MDTPYEGKKKEKPEEAESIWEKLWTEEEKDVDPDKAVEALVEEYVKAKQHIGGEEIAILWSWLEPSYEWVWHMEGNTFRCIRLRVFYYAEHMELGLSEMGASLQDCMQRVLKRSCIVVERLIPMSGEGQYSREKGFVSSQGGAAACRRKMEAAVKEIAKGSRPVQAALLIPDLDIGREGERIKLDYAHDAQLLLAGDNVVLEFTSPFEPEEVYIELAGGILEARRDKKASNRWVFDMGRETTLSDLVFRPLVITFGKPGILLPRYSHGWPSVEGLEVIESLTRAPETE